MRSKLEKFFKSYSKEDLFYIMVALYASTIIFNEFSKFFLWFFGVIFSNFLFKDIYLQVKGDLGLYYSSCFTRIVFLEQ